MADAAQGASGTPVPEGAPGGRRQPVAVITEAQPSYDDAFRARRRRYVVMMLMRLPCLVLAVVFYRTPWLAVLIILVSIPLPWMAVLIANDGPARKTRNATKKPLVNDQRALPATPAQIVDEEPADPRPGE